MPTLISADGSPTGGNGPAAGTVFDRYLGGPYIVTPGDQLPDDGLTVSSQDPVYIQDDY